MTVKVTEDAAHQWVCQNLVRVRRQKGLSQGQAAKLAGMDQSNLCKWERGHNKFLVTTLVRYLGSIGVKWSEFAKE